MKTYLGDAVYADRLDRGGVVLTTNDGLSDTNTIYLELEVLDALFAYLKQRESATSKLLLPPIDAGGPIKTAIVEAIADKLDREIMNMTGDRSQA